MGKTLLINPSGREVEVDSESLPYLTRLGWKEKPHEDIQQEAEAASKEAYYDTPYEKAKAFGEGVVSGATLNLADPLMDDEATRERASQNSGYRFLGEVGGAVGSAVLTGGDSLIAKAAGYTPAGLVERGAQVVAKGANSRAAKGLISGSLEGAGGAIGQNISNAIMGDPMTKESLVSSLGLGTLLGGTIGAVGGKLVDRLDGPTSGYTKRLDGFEMPEAGGTKVRTDDPEIADYDGRVRDAHQRAKDYVDQRIAKGEWFVEEMDRMGNEQILDFRQRFSEAGGKEKMLDELDRDIISSLEPKEREEYLKLREYQVKSADEDTFKKARGSLNDTASMKTQGGGEGLSPLADELLAKADEGGMPAFISQKMRKAAKENGIPLGPDTTPKDIIEGLRQKKMGKGTPAEGVPTMGDLDITEVQDVPKFKLDDRQHALEAVVGKERASRITKQLDITGEFSVGEDGVPGLSYKKNPKNRGRGVGKETKSSYEDSAYSSPTKPSGSNPADEGVEHSSYDTFVEGDPGHTLHENLKGIREHGDTDMYGPPDALYGKGENPELDMLPEYQAADEAKGKLAGLYIAKQMLDKMPDFTYTGMKKMSSKEAVIHAWDFFQRMQEVAPDVAKHFDDAFAGAFNSSAITPAELSEHFKLSQETLEKLGNSGAAKNFAAVWSTIKGVETKAAAPALQDSLDALSDADKKAMTEEIGKANRADDPFEPQGKKSSGGAGIGTRAARVAAGRGASKLLKDTAAGGAIGYALGWGVVDSMLAGGIMGGAGGRIKNLSRSMLKKALTVTAKALQTKGAGFVGEIVTERDALATPYGVGENPEALKKKSPKELFKMRREQATKFQGQYAIDAAAQVLGPVAEFSPELAQQLRDHVALKANYLANAVPKDPPWAAFDEDYAPSDEEIRRFGVVWRAVNDPMSVVSDLAAGYVDPVAAEAFRATAPDLHSAVSGYIMQNVNLAKLSYAQGLNTSIFLGTQVHPDLFAVVDYQNDFMPSEEGVHGQTSAMGAQVIRKSLDMSEDQNVGDRVAAR